MSLLIAEKVQPSRQGIKNFLESYDYKVVEVAHYGELEFTVQNRIDDIDIIIVDYDLADDEGNCAAHTIAQMALGKPVFMMTTETSKQIVLEALEKGVSDIVTKPVDEDLLIKKIRKHLSHSSKDNRLKNDMILDVNTFIDKECTKAKKGHYEVTFMLMRLKGQMKSKHLEEKMYKALESKFWGTDYIIKQKEMCYLGIFPFCSEENTYILEEKVTEVVKSFDEELKGNVSFATYPTVQISAEHIVKLLNEKVRAHADQ